MARRNQRQREYERQQLYRQLAQLEREEQDGITGGAGAAFMGWIAIIASPFLIGIPIVGIPLAILAVVLGIGAIISKPKLEELEEDMDDNLDYGEGASPNNLWRLVVCLFWGFVILGGWAMLGGTAMLAAYTGGK